MVSKKGKEAYQQADSLRGHESNKSSFLLQDQYQQEYFTGKEKE